MKKGLIMEIKDEYAIMLNDDGSMEKIVVKPQMVVGQKIFYFEEDIVKISTTTQSKFKYNVFMKSFGSIAALFLIAFTFFYNIHVNKTYAVVSLDINPSIQLEVGNNKKIINVEGMNDDGKSIDFSSVKGCNINDGIKAVKDILVEKEYLKNNKDVLVGFAFVKNEDKTAYEDNIIDAVLTTFDTENVAYIKVEDKNDVEEAKEQGISLGRYEASKVVDEETKKKIVSAPVKDITEQIKDKENVKYYNADEDKAEDVSAPKEEKVEDKINMIPADKPADNNSNTNNATTKETKENGNNANHKPDIVAPSDEKTPAHSDKSEENNDKSEINNGILELNPEKPAEGENSSNNQDGDKNTVIDPDKNVIENNTTSGKLEEDNKVQEVVPDSSVEKPKEGNIN